MDRERERSGCREKVTRGGGKDAGGVGRWWGLSLINFYDTGHGEVIILGGFNHMSAHGEAVSGFPLPPSSILVPDSSSTPSLLPPPPPFSDSPPQLLQIAMLGISLHLFIHHQLTYIPYYSMSHFTNTFLFFKWRMYPTSSRSDEFFFFFVILDLKSFFFISFFYFIA